MKRKKREITNIGPSSRCSQRRRPLAAGLVPLRCATGVGRAGSGRAAPPPGPNLLKASFQRLRLCSKAVPPPPVPFWSRIGVTSALLPDFISSSVTSLASPPSSSLDTGSGSAAGAGAGSLTTARAEPRVPIPERQPCAGPPGWCRRPASYRRFPYRPDHPRVPPLGGPTSARTALGAAGRCPTGYR